MSRSSVKGEFVDSSKGRIFLLLRYPPATDDRHTGVLIVPPFAEEMNKARRVFHYFAKEATARGLTCALVDLFGTGDSQGSFQDADFLTWQEDVLAAYRWLEACGVIPDRLLGLRLGCLLAATTAERFQLSFRHSMFWHPVLKGSAALTHILRMRVAASMMGESVRESVTELQQRLIGGEAIEAAGYTIGPELAAQLSAADLAATSMAAMGRLGWVEISRNGDKPIRRAARLLTKEAERLGADIYTEQLAGEPFWTSTEIVRNRRLAEYTAQQLIT